MSKITSGRKSNIDMTQGVIWKQLVLFAIPLIMGNIFQQLYNTVDSIVVGNYLGTSALAAVGATTAICNTLVNFFNGISIGAGVVISTCFGSRNHEKLHEAVETTILFAVIVGCFVSLISVWVVPLMLKWMSTPDDVIGPAGEYLKIYFTGVPVLFLYNMSSAILRAVGDTKRPLNFLIISSCLNIALDILFVAKFGWGISGVAIATVIAEAVSAALACSTLMRTKEAHRLVLRDLHINKSCLGEIFRIGLPAGVQQGLTAFSNALVQSYVNGLGSSVIMAGWSCHSKIDQFAILPAQSMGQAATTFVGQNLGAKNVERARDGVKQAVFMGVGVLICISGAMALSARFLVSLFNQDPDVLHYGTLFILMTVPFRFCSSFNQILAGSLRGSGDAKGPMCIMLFSFVVCRQIYLFFVTKIAFNEYTVGMGYPVGWIVCAILSFLYYRRSRWEEKVKED